MSNFCFSLSKHEMNVCFSTCSVEDVDVEQINVLNYHLVIGQFYAKDIGLIHSFFPNCFDGDDNTSWCNPLKGCCPPG